jgi:GTP-binding protein Era
MHGGVRALNLALSEQVDEAAADCDVALLLVDPREDWGEDHAELLARLGRRETPVLVVATKLDLVSAPGLPGLPPGVEPWRRISAATGEGVDELLEALRAHLPEAPRLYPEDQLSDRPLRFLVAELVREAAFRELAQELPYALAVEIVEFDESRPDLVRIRADLLVERGSQKQIVIGAGGAMIKRIGAAARPEIEKLLDTRVHLGLWVKLEPHWMKRPNRLKSLGYW